MRVTQDNIYGSDNNLDNILESLHNLLIDLSREDLKSNNLINQLVEHTGAVCSLNNSQTNLLYSGSFDCTAKIWNLADLKSNNNSLKSILTLKGILKSQIFRHKCINIF